MFMDNWIGALSIFIYCSAALFIVVDGQTPTADIVDQLADTIAGLQTELAKGAAKNEKLEAEHAELRAKLAESKAKVATLKTTTLNNNDNRKYIL